ncbi:P-type DNA transfer ATPase VirB11 [Sphingomonas sp. SUN019]|nr:P-type DNA transfer ATPase VirB11 [Sphingomonas sp. SUN019]
MSPTYTSTGPAKCGWRRFGGATERHEIAELDETTLLRLARQVASYNHQGISREHPLLSAGLPDGSRIQVVAAPATRGPMALAIRKHVSTNLTLEHYITSGSFDDVQTQSSATQPIVEAVAKLVDRGEIAEGLRQAVRGRLNVLISGGTSTGKTTFLNALIGEIPAQERLILIEDTAELRLQHTNAIGLLAARSALGEADVTTNDLVSASLRMRPDRIILGELRGREAFAFLRAVNTGHPGSMTTIHADSVDGAVEQLALLILEGGTTLSRADIARYVGVTIDVFVQLARDEHGRRVSECRVGVPDR